MNEIPEWQVANDKIEKGKSITVLEKFVYDNEPAGKVESERFRTALKNVLNERDKEIQAFLIICKGKDTSPEWIRKKANELLRK